MYLILNDKVALRSFLDKPFAYHIKGSFSAKEVSQKVFDLLLKCDGQTFVKKSKLVDLLIEKNYCVECEKGCQLTKWQKLKVHDNVYMPRMNLQITGRCNYNCVHCFNAKDNAPLQSELSLQQIKTLLDECEECGVYEFTITGGEPMAHPHYKEIIEEIYKRGLRVFDLNTNGFYINQQMLDWMKSINYYPLIKISFDGLGFHNWMRGYDKAEEITLNAIKLCVDNGFRVKAQVNVNNKNISSILPTLSLLDQMSVEETRLIKTTNAPRWLQNSQNDSMSLEQYFDAILDVLKGYLAKERQMAVTAWLLCRVDPKGKYYNYIPVQCQKDDFSQDYPLCKGVRRMIAVGSNGNVFPCMQSQGWYEEHQMLWGNILTDGLQNILKESKYLNLINLNLQDRLKSGSQCKDCKYLKACVGGCPAIAQLTSGDILLEDKSKCVFFKKGYYQKFENSILKEYKNIKPLDI